MHPQVADGQLKVIPRSNVQKRPTSAAHPPQGFMVRKRFDMICIISGASGSPYSIFETHEAAGSPMIRPQNVPKPVPLTPADLAKAMATVGPLNVLAAFYRARASTGAEALETAAKRNGSEQAAKPNEEQEGTEEKAEEEDVIDKVAKLYDVY